MASRAPVQGSHKTEYPDGDREAPSTTGLRERHSTLSLDTSVGRSLTLMWPLVTVTAQTAPPDGSAELFC